MTAIALVLLAVVLTAREFAYGHQWQDVYITEAREGMADFKKKQNEILEVLKGFEDLQQKQKDILVNFSGYEDLQQKQNYILAKLSGLHRDLELVKGAVNRNQDSLQNFHHELEYVQGAVNSNQDSLQYILAKLETLEGIHREPKGCLGMEDLEHVFKNISAADESLEESHNCTDYEACTYRVFKYQCSCLPGFAWDGSRCEDVDECAQGKAECSAQATCRNSVGSYSCSCNPPFEGDGRTCELSCKNVEGLGCVKKVEEWKTFEVMNATCHEAGGRLLQNLSPEHVQEVGRAFGISSWWRWIGVHEGRWLESGLPLPEELWKEGSRGSDPSKRTGLCGYIYLDRSSNSYKVSQRDCSEKTPGFCHLVIQQK